MRLMRCQVVCVVAAAILCATPRTAPAQESGAARKLVPVVLREIPLGEIAIRPTKAELPDVVDATCQALRRGILIIGKPALSAEQLRGLQGKSARDAIGAIAQALQSEWQRYDEFYVIWPIGMERHDAVPVRWSQRYKELNRPLDGVFNADFTRAVRAAGRSGNTTLLLGPAETREAMQRAVLPVTWACHGRTVDELMQALTAVTGDPWEHLGHAHLLCFSGKPLTPAQREQMATGVAAAEFTQGLTERQERALQSPEGMDALQLSPLQRERLAAATARMRPAGLGVEALILRRVATGDGGNSDRLYVEGNTASGRVRLGMIAAPLDR